MIIFDSSYLIAFLHSNPPAPKDRADKPVEKFKERIQALVNNLNGTDTLIGVPAPVVAEILVRYESDKDEYLNTLRNRYRFDIIPFGLKAAIEASDLVAILKREHKKQPGEQWAKIKFDIQITATAKAEMNLTMLYADDVDIENYAKRIGIPVTRICDLPIPPEPTPAPVPVADENGQTNLFETEKQDENEETITKDDNQQDVAAEPETADSERPSTPAPSASVETTHLVPGRTLEPIPEETNEKEKEDEQGRTADAGHDKV